MATCDVAIVGAGPYGLSAAAHLRAANGLDIRVFGEPMSFWEKHMPKGMLLRSPLAGSHLSDPARSLTLQDYENANKKQITAPLPLHRFTDYGRWFQSQAVPDLDPRNVDRVEENLLEDCVMVAAQDSQRVLHVARVDRITALKELVQLAQQFAA